MVDAMIDGEIGKIKRCQVSYKSLVRARRLFPRLEKLVMRTVKYQMSRATARPQ